MARVPEVTNHFALGPWANWLWLADLPSQQTVLCLGGDDGMATALARHFDTVKRGALEPNSWAQVTCDLVVIGAVVNHDGEHTTPDSLWSVCHRVLRPGGCLMITCENPLWYHRPRLGVALVPRSLRARRQRRAIQAAGFQQVRRYYVAPSYQEPHTIVPIDRRIIAGYEEIEMKLATRRGLRSRLSRLGDRKSVV